MKSHLRFMFLLLPVLILFLISLSCSKTNLEVTPIQIDPNNKEEQNSHISARDAGTIYNDWVDTINDFNADFFSHEDITTLNFSYIWGKYITINTGASPSDSTALKEAMRNTLMSVQYVGLDNYLLANPFIHENGTSALLDLKDDVLTMIDNSTSYSTMQSYLQTTAEDALADEDLDPAEQASVFLACAAIEGSLNTELQWGFKDQNHVSSRRACNLHDIWLTFIIIGTVEAVSLNAINAITHTPGKDLTDSVVKIVGKAISVANMINMASPLLPWILATSALGAIIGNCWEVILDFFVNVWTGIWNFVDGIFGHGEECNDPTSITAFPIDCAGDEVAFTANDAGPDVVAYSWRNVGTDPSEIITQTRTSVFATTSSSITIRVTGICSNGDNGDEITQIFGLGNIINYDPPTEVEFVEFLPTPHVNHEYEFDVVNGPGPNEHITWSGSAGVTIGEHEDNFAMISFTTTGSKTITARITNDCNTHWHEDSLILTVYP